MALDRPPDLLHPGDYSEWEVSLPDYPSSAGWSLKYAFVSTSEMKAVPADFGTVTDSGSGDWKVTLAASETNNFSDLGSDGISGDYRWKEYVEKASGTERRTLREGNMLLKVDLAAIAATGLDFRSHVKKTLDAIEALLEGKALKDVDSYSIAQRSLAKMRTPELLRWRAIYQSLYEAEVAKDRIARGQGNPALVKLRFTNG